MYGDVVSTSRDTASISQVIGGNARTLRLEAGGTLEQMARAAKDYDLPWTTGRVGSFERGRFTPTADVLYATAAALGQVIGRPVRLTELLATDKPVRINDKLTIPAAAMLGEVVPIPAEFGGHGALLVKAQKVPPEQYVRNTFREGDERMCRSLGVDRDTGIAAMAKCWGKAFTARRDELAEPGANAQRRGIIARALKAELQKAIPDGDH